MALTPAGRAAQGHLAVTAREHGPHSPRTHAARLEYQAVKLADAIADMRAKYGAFTPEQRSRIIDALEDREVLAP